MNRSEIERQVESHYTRGDATQRVLNALGLQDAIPGSVAVETLFPIDQLHHGGVGLTEKMAAAAQIGPDSTVLDAGSGVGGTARFLVDRFNCSVTAMDLSEEFVQTAGELDRLVGMSDKITHQVGSVLDLPFDPDSFDIVWTQNVTMNVSDKATMFAEAFRVLRPGGIYVLTHIGQNPGTQVTYPMPWAMTEDTSFPTAPDAFLDLLKAAGFVDATDHSAATPPPPPPPAKTGAADDSAVMGDNMEQRRANVAQAMASGAMAAMLVTAKRP